MCGYIELNGERTWPIMQHPEHAIANQFLSRSSKRYYPAFGQDVRRTIDIVIEENKQLKQVAATWWFDCSLTEHGLQVGHRTTYNARNLQSPFWQPALQHNRAIVFATGIGESKMVGKTKHQYYMQSEDLFALGALYQKFADGSYSCAVITRDAHPKMQAYHDKAFPGFLPTDDEFLALWLSKEIQQHPLFEQELNNPKLYPTLRVQRVKTYKDKVPYSSFTPVVLQSDLATH